MSLWTSQASTILPSYYHHVHRATNRQSRCQQLSNYLLAPDKALSCHSRRLQHPIPRRRPTFLNRRLPANNPTHYNVRHIHPLSPTRLRSANYKNRWCRFQLLFPRSFYLSFLWLLDVPRQQVISSFSSVWYWLSLALFDLVIKHSIAPSNPMTEGLLCPVMLLLYGLLFTWCAGLGWRFFLHRLFFCKSSMFSLNKRRTYSTRVRQSVFCVGVSL